MTAFQQEGVIQDSARVPDDTTDYTPANLNELLHSTVPKTYHQWQLLRRTLGAKYHEPKVLRQMTKDAQTLGRAFFDHTLSNLAEGGK